MTPKRPRDPQPARQVDHRHCDGAESLTANTTIQQGQNIPEPSKGRTFRSTGNCCALTTGVILQTDRLPPLDSQNKKGTMFLICSHIVGSRTMLRMFVEEAAALASITLFVAMIAVWAQVIPQL